MSEPKVRMTNRQFSEKDQNFKNACVKAGVAPTVRQASKFRMKQGLAYNNPVKEK